MISKTAEYALRAVVCLAGRLDRPMLTPDIASATRVPPGYLSKVLQVLGRAGIVSSRRGLYGGFVLAKSPGELTALDVIRAVDPLKRIERCPLGLKGHDPGLCPLHERLDRIMAEAEDALASFTMEDLISEPREITPLGLSFTHEKEETSSAMGEAN